MGKDVLCPDTPGKVVALPIRPIARGMPFHHPVVIGHSRIVESRPPHAHSRRIDKVSGDINLQSGLQLPICQWQRKQVMIQWRLRCRCEKPVDMNRRHIGLHLCLQPSKLIPQRRTVRVHQMQYVIGVFLLYLGPGIVDGPIRNV